MQGSPLVQITLKHMNARCNFNESMDYISRFRQRRAKIGGVISLLHNFPWESCWSSLAMSDD
jgi:hypothetical protein